MSYNGTYNRSHGRKSCSIAELQSEGQLSFLDQIAAINYVKLDKGNTEVHIPGLFDNKTVTNRLDIRHAVCTCDGRPAYRGMGPGLRESHVANMKP